MACFLISERSMRGAGGLPPVTPPVISITLSLPTASGQTLVREATSLAGAIVTFNVSANSNGSALTSFTVDHPSGGQFPIGTTQVHVAATNQSGGSASDFFNVVVRDSTPPVITISNLSNAMSHGEQVPVTWTATASDAVSGTSTPICTPASGSLFDLGETEVTCTATDTIKLTPPSGPTTVTSTLTFDVEVIPPPTQLVVTPTAPTIGVGKHVQMVATGTFVNGCVMSTDGTQSPECGGGGGTPTAPPAGSLPGYILQFSPALPLSVCSATNLTTIIAQSVSPAPDGSVNTTFAGALTVTAPAGSFTGTAPSAGSPVTVTIKCSSGSLASGSIQLSAFNGSQGAATGPYQLSTATGTGSALGWFGRASMPTPRFAFGAGTVNNVVYAIGGLNTTGTVGVVEKFDPSAPTIPWTSGLTPMPTPRFGFATVTIGNLIYTIGGNTAKSDQTNVVEVYNTATDAWTSLPPMPTARGQLGAAYLVNGGQTTIYAIGGVDVFGNAVNTVEAFDVDGVTWSTGSSPMPTARGLLEVAAVPVVAPGGGPTGTFKIVAAGGQSTDGNLLTVTEVFDGSTWTSGSPMSNPTAAVPAVAPGGAIAGVMYVGGVGGAPIQVYNLLTDTWSFQPGLPWTLASGTGAGGATTANSVFVTFGGEDWQGTPLATTASFSLNPSTAPLGGQWNLVFNPPLFVPCTNMYFGGAAPLGVFANGSFMLGGFGTGSISSTAVSGAFACGNGVMTGSITPAAGSVNGAIVGQYSTGTIPPGQAVAQSGAVYFTRNVFASGGSGQDSGSGQDITWSLDTPGTVSNGVARIDRNGRVTGLGNGTTTVLATFNGASCADTMTCATVTVDGVAPVVTVPSDITVTAAAGQTSAAATFSATATDNIDGAVTPVCTPASGSTFAAGPTVVSCTATDAVGNTSAASTFTVKVLLTSNASIVAPATAAYHDVFGANAFSESSSQPVISANGACSFDSGTGLVTMTSGTGTCNLSATWAADGTYAAANASTSVLATKRAQVLYGYPNGIPSFAVYGTSFTLQTTGETSSPVVITSSGACTNVGTTVTMTSGTGNCVLDATWPADANYQSASVTNGIVQAQTLDPTVSLTGVPATAAYGSSFTVSPNTNSTAAAQVFAVGACSSAGNVVTMTSGSGECMINAAWFSDGNYSSAATPPQTVTATMLTPTVSFTGAPGGAGYTTTFTVSATSSASLPVTINAAGACSISGNLVTMTSGTGTCGLTATWYSNGNYTGATASQSTTASKIAPTASFVGLPTSEEIHSTFQVVTSTNASTAAAVTVTGSCTIAGDVVTMASGTGACRVTAKWPADSNFLAATLTKNVTATKIVPAVTFTAPATAVSGTSFDVVTTSDDPNAVVAVTVTSGPCSIVDHTVTMMSGTGTCHLKATWPTDADYKAATLTQATTAQKITPTITWSDPASIVYGTALDGVQLDATLSVGGTPKYAPNTGAILAAGTHLLKVTYTPDDTANYATLSATVTLTVTPATPTLTWATPAAITYGTALSGAQLKVLHPGVTGTVVYDQPATTVLPAGTQTLTATFTSTNANYTGGTASTTLVVNQAVPKITWRSNVGTITYGTLLDSTQLNAVANVPGSFTYTPPAGTQLSAGTLQTLLVAFTPADAANYTGASDTATITVKQAKPALAWATPAPIVKGTALTGAQLNATADVPGTFAYSSPEETVLSVGNHTVTATFTPNDTTDYLSTAKVSVVVTVTK